MNARLLHQLRPMTSGVLRVASPRHRRWHRTLAGCTLEPAAVTAAVAPGPRDVLICGCPRSGTALLTAALHQPPVMCTVMEPWAGLQQTPRQLFGSIRDELDAGELRQGRLRIDRLLADGAVEWQRDGEQAYAVEAGPRTLVGVKWPSYWQLLGRLPDTKFLVCLRDPAEVLHSFVHTGGRLARGYDYDTTFTRDFNRRLADRYDDAADRRLGMYDAVYEHALPHLRRSNVLAVRYERWFEEPDAMLREIGDFLGADLGRSRVRIRPPASHPHPQLAARIRRQSRTAARLGYR